MIPRPQTILLLVVITLLLIVAIPAPMWSKLVDSSGRDQHYCDDEKYHLYQLTPWAFEELGAYGNLRTSTAFPYAVVGWLTLLAAGLAIFELFSFKNRTRQLQLGRLNTWLIVVMMGLRIYFAWQKEKYIFPDLVSSGFTPWDIFAPLPTFPVIVLLINLMANYFIRKDEKLVRSADRMR